jgi:hypothetical protein
MAEEVMIQIGSNESGIAARSVRLASEATEEEIALKNCHCTTQLLIQREGSPAGAFPISSAHFWVFASRRPRGMKAPGKNA